MGYCRDGGRRILLLNRMAADLLLMLSVGIYWWISETDGRSLKSSCSLSHLSLPRNKVMEAVLEQIGIISFSNLDMLVFPVQIPD